MLIVRIAIRICCGRVGRDFVTQKVAHVINEDGNPGFLP